MNKKQNDYLFELVKSINDVYISGFRTGKESVCFCTQCDSFFCDCLNKEKHENT